MLELKGIMEAANLQCMTVKKVQKNLKASIMGFVGRFFLVEVTTVPHQVLANAEITGLLADYIRAQPVKNQQHGHPTGNMITEFH